MPARILVIEDNPTNLELLSYLLTSFGHKVIAAGDGESGLEMARQEKPELVICDVQMPGMDGYQVAKEFKQDAALHKIPLIAVTAYAMVGDRERLVAVGFDGYMSKPIDPGKFVVEIQKFLSPEQQSVQPVVPETLTQTVPRLNNAEATATLLVIDDSEVNLNLMRTLFEPAGYRVFTAADPHQALALAQQHRPDLIISDVHLAYHSGYEVPTLIRQDPELKSIPCILISSTERNAAASIRSGAEMFILRPIDPEQLLQEISRCLQRVT